MTDVRRDTRQQWSFVPALLVCAAAPAFFVLEIPWIGWTLLAVGIGVAGLIERGRQAEDQVVRAGARRETATVVGVHRPPSSRGTSR